MATTVTPEERALLERPSHMHAAVVEAFDRPLRYGEVDVPVPGPGARHLRPLRVGLGDGGFAELIAVASSVSSRVDVANADRAHAGFATLRR